VTDEDIQVVRDDGAGRYEARLDGQVGRFADFEAAADRIIFTHTEVDSAFEHEELRVASSATRWTTCGLADSR